MLVKGVQVECKLRECMVFEGKGSCLCCVTQGVCYREGPWELFVFEGKGSALRVRMLGVPKNKIRFEGE